MSKAPRTIVSSGCKIGANGNVPCAPESMRASAERWLHDRGYYAGKSLSLEAYTLARYMTSEQGNGTVEEMLATGECAVNRGKLSGTSATTVLLYRTKGSTGYGSYGEIQSGSSGRWASTSRDPNVVSLLLADLILSGKSGNFNRGADDQASLAYPKYYPSVEGKLVSLAKGGNYWVGQLPGVDPWHTIQVRRYGVSLTSTAGAALLKRSIDYFSQFKIDGGRRVSTLVQVNPTVACVGGESDTESVEPMTPGKLLAMFFLGSFALGAGLVAARIALTPMPKLPPTA